MTVDELHDVLQREFDGVNARLDKLNGKIDKHEVEITGLKVSDAFWAGGAVVIGTIIGWFWRH